MASTPGISRDIIAGVRRALGELGADVTALTAELTGNDTFVEGALADALLDQAAKHLGDDALGIHLAEKLPIGALGPLDYALCTSASLRQALTRVARYYGVATQRVDLALVEEGPRALLRFSRQPRLKPSRHWLEFSFAAIVSRVRQALGRPVTLLEVTFAHPAPGQRALDEHARFFGVQPVFSTAVDVMALPVEQLDWPLQTAAEALAQTLEARLKELKPTLTSDPLIDRVRKAVSELLDLGVVGLEPTARRLRRSPRTLQRELQQRQTSHQTLLDQIRRDRALALLEEPRTNVTEVAYRLGFSEPSAFFRAFRRWTGSTPASMRTKPPVENQ